MNPTQLLATYSPSVFVFTDDFNLLYSTIAFNNRDRRTAALQKIYSQQTRWCNNIRIHAHVTDAVAISSRPNLIKRQPQHGFPANRK